MFMQRVIMSSLFLLIFVYAIFERDNYIAFGSGAFFILCYIVKLDHQEDN